MENEEGGQPTGEGSDKLARMNYMVEIGQAKDLVDAARRIEIDALPEDPVIEWVRKFSEHAPKEELAKKLGEIIEGIGKEDGGAEKQLKTAKTLIGLGFGESVDGCRDRFAEENQTEIEKLLSGGQNEVKE